MLLKLLPHFAPVSLRHLRQGVESKRNTVGVHLWRQRIEAHNPFVCLHSLPSQVREGTLNPVSFPPEMNTWQILDNHHAYVLTSEGFGGKTVGKCWCQHKWHPLEPVKWFGLVFFLFNANDNDNNECHKEKTPIYTWFPHSSASAVAQGLGRFGSWFRFLNHQNLFSTVMVSVCP